MSTTDLSSGEDLRKLVEKLQHEKTVLERDLKKKTDLLELSKDKKQLLQTMDENSKLKQDVEMLDLFKSQNAGLKEHMHQLAEQSDAQRVKLATAVKENMELKAKLSPEQQLEVSQNNASLDPLIKEFETTVAELRTENQRLEESLKKAQEEVAAEKKKAAAAIEAAAKTSAASTTPATSAAPASATGTPAVSLKAWWGSKPTAQTTAAVSSSSAATVAPPAVVSGTPGDTAKLEEQLKTAHAEIEKLKTQVNTLEAISTASSPQPDGALEDAKKEHAKAVESLRVEMDSLKTQLQQEKDSSSAGNNGNQVADIEKSLHDAKAALEKVNEEANAYKLKLQDNEVQIQRTKELESQLVALGAELKSTSLSLEASKSEATKLQTKLHQDITLTTTKTASLEKSLANATTQITTLTASLKDQTDKIQTLLTESNTLKSTHDKTLQALQSEKNSLVSSYEATIRGLQETVAKKSMEVQKLQSKSAANIAASPSAGGEGETAPAEAVEPASAEKEEEVAVDFIETLKSGYEKDKLLATERIGVLESKISTQLSELEETRTALNDKVKECETLKQSGREAVTVLETQLRDKESEVAGLSAARDQLRLQVEETEKKIADGAQNSVEMQKKVTSLQKEHSEAIQSYKAEIELAHQKAMEKLRDDGKKEKLELESKAAKDRDALDAKFKKEKAALEEAAASITKEVEQLRKEMTEFKDNASKGSKSSEAQIKALEDKSKKDLVTMEENHKKEISELHETSKRSLADLESRLKKEQASAEEKSVKAKMEVEEKKRKELEEKLTKEKRDLEEKLRKEQAALDEKHQKDKTDSEEKFKKDKSKIQSDLDIAKSEVDRLKKDVAAHETQKTEQAKKFEKELFSRNDDIGKYTTRIKTVESDLESFKAESAKSTSELNDKITTANGTIAKLTEEIGAEKQQYSLLQQELKGTQDKMTALQTKMDVVTAELEVSRNSSLRLSKTNGEKDDAIKKLKQRVDELTQTQTTLAKTITTLEKDKELLNQTIAAHSKKISELDTRLVQQQNEFTESRQVDLQNNQSLNEAITALKTENFDLTTKVKDVQSEHRAMEKRGALIMRDLQKQIAKERKRQGSAEIQESSESLAVATSASHSRQTSDNIVLTTELLQLAKENETLNKRSKNAEEEIRTLHDRLTKQAEELELKSKAVQQYMLREYSAQIAPSENKKGGFSMDMLTNAGAMQKMNPMLLTQVNIKMQKLLEELTSKMMGLEEEIRVLKS
ncbi:hypothetical protein HDU98_001978 [Podochytrium sp. JEL0797]|nr:hypothetical protein HDU98_001978 [Podochytrium sp. JEL0797]